MIRRADINDVKLLQEIGKKTFNDTFGNTCTKEDMKGVLQTFFNTVQIESELRDEEDYFYFMEDEGVVKGYMRINAKHSCPIASIQNNRCIELVRLYVLQEYHGHGIANSLMDFAIEFARSRGYEKMYLSVWEYNFRARGFYEKHGFANSGVKNDFPLGTTPQTDYWFIKDLM